VAAVAAYSSEVAAPFVATPAMLRAHPWLRLFPLATGDKRPGACFSCIPKHANGLKDATGDLERTRQLAVAHPAANIGCRTGSVDSGGSGFFALDLDVDVSRGIDGMAALVALDVQLPRTVAMGTPRGGMQAFFRIPAGWRVNNSVSKIATGVDTRGEGGYTVLPPSTRPDGDYAWLPGCSVDETEIAEPPAELWALLIEHEITRPIVTRTHAKRIRLKRPRERAQRPREGRKQTERYQRACEGVPEGERHAAMLVIAGNNRGRDLPWHECERQLKESAARCDPPYPEVDALDVGRDIYQKPAGCRGWEPERDALAVAFIHSVRDCPRTIKVRDRSMAITIGIAHDLERHRRREGITEPLILPQARMADVQGISQSQVSRNLARARAIGELVFAELPDGEPRYLSPNRARWAGKRSRATCYRYTGTIRGEKGRRIRLEKTPGNTALSRSCILTSYAVRFPLPEKSQRDSQVAGLQSVGMSAGNPPPASRILAASPALRVAGERGALPANELFSHRFTHRKWESVGSTRENPDQNGWFLIPGELESERRERRLVFLRAQARAYELQTQRPDPLPRCKTGRRSGERAQPDTCMVCGSRDRVYPAGPDGGSGCGPCEERRVYLRAQSQTPQAPPSGAGPGCPGATG